MTNKAAGIRGILLRPESPNDVVQGLTAEAGTAAAGHTAGNLAAASADIPADTEAKGPADNRWEPADIAEQACHKAVRAEA